MYQVIIFYTYHQRNVIKRYFPLRSLPIWTFSCRDIIKRKFSLDRLVAFQLGLVSQKLLYFLCNMYLISTFDSNLNFFSTFFGFHLKIKSVFSPPLSIVQIITLDFCLLDAHFLSL